MILDISEGGKQILDIPARNEAIDLWNLQSYLKQGPKRASWCYFVDFLLINFLETSYLKLQPGQIMNVFLQDIHVPISQRTPLPEEIKRMILIARKYKLKFTGLSVNNEVKLKMLIWRHPITNKVLYQQACRREAATCLRLNHQAQSVEDILTIARRRTIVTRKPHQVNPSGIGRKNCGCPLCYQDRTLLGCNHPGQCIETAKILVDSILAKWNPTMPNLDLCQELALTDDEMRWNSQPIETNQIMVFDPNFALSDMGSGF
jgi:hypothetical protein